MADDFQYYFDENFFEKNTAKDYNLFDRVYFDSIMQFSEDYKEALKQEVFYKEKNKESFSFPFTNYNYHSGDELPYMLDYLF